VARISNFCDIALCSLYTNQRFRGTFHFHLQDRKSVEQEANSLIYYSTVFDPEDGSDTSHRNVGSYTDYAAVCFRVRKLSELPCENLRSYIKVWVARKMLVAELQRKEYIGLCGRKVLRCL
jgi:hypothetical protein